MKDVTDVEFIKLKAEALDAGHLKLATWGTKEYLADISRSNKGDTKMRNTTIEDNIKKMLEKDFERVGKFDTEKGGIYVETTEDPRGWMLGDKTRKKYKVPNLISKVLTDLLMIVKSTNDDGTEIKVSIYNSEDIGRMLLSKNDDVGSSIQYAQVVSSKPTELVAKMGEHVCIEPLMRGSWIRMHVFPGENMLEAIKNDDSEIFGCLESSGVDMKKVLARLVSKYVDIEKEINVLLPKMERYGNSCTCEDPTIFKQIFQGKYDEITEICIECGGTIER